MEKQRIPGATVSDESLVLRARAGDRNAFAELWLRHARSGVRIARQFTSSIDADDLVSEAYARIYQRVLAGGGPNGAFRPYLYTTIRNLACRWGQARHDVNVDDLDELEDRVAADDPAATALDRTLTVRAFRSLPERWQSVLWYTEVEGMDPHEVAPILGISANSVAALSYRAREGLRKAWLQAHVSDATASGECQWTIGRLGEHARRGLTLRDHQRVSRHLAECTRCSIISEEVDDVGSRLALVMVPLLLGGVVGGSVLASLSAPSSAVAASAVPATPPAFGAMGVAATPAVAASLSASALCAPLVGTFAIALAVVGGLAATNPVPAVPPQSTSVVQTAPGPSSANSPVGTSLGETAPDAGGASQAAPQTVATPPAESLDGALSPVDGALAPVTQPLSGAVAGVVGGVDTTVGGLVKVLPDPVTTVPNLGGAAAVVPDVSAVIPGVAAAIAPVLGSSAAPGATVSIPLSGILGQ